MIWNGIPVRLSRWRISSWTEVARDFRVVVIIICLDIRAGGLCEERGREGGDGALRDKKQAFK
jgi:hypothetical protein